jgi:hypothetical protein
MIASMDAIEIDDADGPIIINPYHFLLISVYRNMSSAPSSPRKRTCSRPVLSLLDGSPDGISTVKKKNHSQPAAEVASADPYEQFLYLAAKWKAEMEAVRDSIYLLQVENAQNLDNLCMAGAEISN